MNTEESKKIFDFLIDELGKHKLSGYGLDVIQEKGSKMFYLIDFNFDILTFL